MAVAVDSIVMDYNLLDVNSLDTIAWSPRGERALAGDMGGPERSLRWGLLARRTCSNMLVASQGTERKAATASLLQGLAD